MCKRPLVAYKREWNCQLIDMLFQQLVESSIKQTTIIPSQEEDILCWKLTPSCKCTTKSAYRACLQNLQEQGEPALIQVQTDIVHLLKKIWKNKQITPRVQTFGWKFLRRALPTGARAGNLEAHFRSI